MISNKVLKAILLTENQFKNYSKFLEKFPQYTTENISKGMEECEYKLFKGVPVIAFANKIPILRDFTLLSENDFSQWKREFYKIPYEELNNDEQLTASAVIW